MASSTRRTVGVALSATELTAAWPAPGGGVSSMRLPVASYPGDTGAWPAMAAALGEVAAAAGLVRGRLVIALLPPFVEVRQLEMPPLGQAELVQLLARNSGRYFLAARGPQIVGALASGPRGRSAGPAPVLAAAQALSAGITDATG